jgi:hypothetical protein
MAFESPDFETANSLLKRDWFDSIQDIHDLLRTTSNTVFWELFHNRGEYSSRVRQVIAPRDYIPDRALLKMNVAELTDDHMSKFARERRDEIKAMMKKEWESYMQKHCPIRPREDDIDEKIYAKNAEIAEAQKKIEEYNDKRKNGDKLALKRFDKMIDDLKKNMDDLETERIKTDIKWLEMEEVRYHEQVLLMPDQDISTD